MKTKKLLLTMCVLTLMLHTVGMGAITAKADDAGLEIIQELLKEKVSGKFFVSDNLVYHVIGKNKVEVCGRTNKKVKKVVKIPAKVTYKKKKYTVTQIPDMKAFDIGGYGEYYGEELSSPSYYDDVYTRYDYSNAYGNSLPKGTRKLSAVKLILPKTITYIGEGAFAGDTSLKEVKFASKYKKLVIGKAAFDRCNLKAMNFPKGTTEIRDYAIDAKVITIPASVKKIGAGVVDKNTTKVSINKKNKHFKIKKNVLYSYDETKLIGVSAKASKVLQISSKTTEIGEAAFASSKVSEVNLGGNVKVIHAKAFAKCMNLKELTGTENLEKISYGAFFGCGVLEKIENVSNVKEIETAAFWHTGNITLPISSNMKISDYAFSGLADGTFLKVTVPQNDSIYSLENGLLMKKEGDRKKVILQTENMEKIVVPEGVTDVMVVLGTKLNPICKEVVLPTSQKVQMGDIHIVAGNVQFLAETAPVFGDEFMIHSWNGTGKVTVPKGCKNSYRTAIDTAHKDYGYSYFDSMFEMNMTLQEAK